MFTDEYLSKIRELLLSKNQENVLLGVQLVSKKFPPELIQDFYALSLFQHSGRIYTKVRRLFKRHAPPALWEFSVRKRINLRAEPISVIEAKLISFCNHPAIDKKVIGWYALKKAKKGIRFCLKNQIRSDFEILEAIIENQELDLSHLHLEELPKAIGQFPNLRVLDISYNNFSDLPEEIALLKKLENIEAKSLDEALYEKLEHLFPKIFAEKYVRTAGDYLNDVIRGFDSFMLQNYLNQAKKNLQKAESLYTQTGMLWNAWGAYWKLKGDFSQATECLQKAIEIEKDTCPIFYYTNLANTLKAQNRLDEVIELCEKGEEIFAYRKMDEKKEYSYLYAYKALAMFHQQRYEESILVNQEAIMLFKENGMAVYNTACAYAKLKERDKLLATLQKAVAISSKYKSEAQEDKDFTEYFEDEDFKKIVGLS